MLNTNLAEQRMIEDAKLEMVSGGGDVRIGNCIFSGFVGKYNAVPGTHYYVVWNDGSNDWWYGKMLDTYEGNMTFYTLRTHRFHITMINGKPADYPKAKIMGDKVSLYTTMTRV